MVTADKQADNDRKLTRRALIAAGGLSLASATAGWIMLRTGRLRGFYLRLAYPEPEPAMTGPVEGELLRTLRAVAETLVGDGPAATRSIEMLKVRARELDGHLGMQRRFADWLDKLAQSQGARSFRDAIPESRMDLLASCMRLRTDVKLRRVWAATVFRNRVLWDRQILHPILELYSRSDAWLELGYDSFPGDPSGLDDYREPPLSVANSIEPQT